MLPDGRNPEVVVSLFERVVSVFGILRDVRVTWAWPSGARLRSRERSASMKFVPLPKVSFSRKRNAE